MVSEYHHLHCSHVHDLFPREFTQPRLLCGVDVVPDAVGSHVGIISLVFVPSSLWDGNHTSLDGSDACSRNFAWPSVTAAIDKTIMKFRTVITIGQE